MTKILVTIFFLSFFALAIFGPEKEKLAATICGNTWMAVWLLLDQLKTKAK